MVLRCLRLSRVACIRGEGGVAVLVVAVWPWPIMLLLLRDYATFDYAK